jgi:hypothetical protein
MRVYWFSTCPGEHAAMLSVVGCAETANAGPATIAAANPAMTISRRGWTWKDTIVCSVLWGWIKTNIIVN